MDEHEQPLRRRSIFSLISAPYKTAAGTVTASPGVRKLAILTGINALGNGLFATINIIFYTQHLGFSIGFVSAALFGATVLAIGGDFLSGKVSDLYSPKPVFLAGLILSAAATMLLLAVWNGVSFMVALCLISLGQGMCMSSNTTLIRRLARENPALTRASLRSLLTIGISVGAALAGVILANGTLPAFQVAISINALTFVISAALLGTILVPAAPAGAPGRPNPILPDARFATFSLANGVIGVYMHALSFAVPLWMVRHHPELTWLVGALVAVNSLLVATLQVPASAGIANTRTASHRLVLGASCLAASYLFFVSGWSGSVVGLVVAVIVFLILHTLGEVLYSAGSMELLFRMAPESKQGQYGAFFGISNGLMASLAPAILGLAIATSSGWGWWLLAALTLGLALLIRAISSHKTVELEAQSADA